MQICKCGCGGRTVTGEFLRGHAARYYAKLRKGLDGDERYEYLYMAFEDDLCNRIDNLLNITDLGTLLAEGRKLQEEVERYMRLGVLTPGSGGNYLNTIVRRINDCTAR